MHNNRHLAELRVNCYNLKKFTMSKEILTFTLKERIHINERTM